MLVDRVHASAADQPHEVHRPAALRRRESRLRPSERTIAVEEGVLLFDAEPCIVLFVLLRHLAKVRARVAPVHRAVRIQYFIEHEDVVLAMQWIGNELHGTQQQIAEMSAGLICRRSVVSPLRDIAQTLHRTVDDLRFRTKLRRRFLTVNPNVFRLDFCQLFYLRQVGWRRIADEIRAV